MKFTVLEALHEEDGGVTFTMEREDFLQGDGSAHAIVITFPAAVLESLNQRSGADVTGAASTSGVEVSDGQPVPKGE